MQLGRRQPVIAEIGYIRGVLCDLVASVARLVQRHRIADLLPIYRLIGRPTDREMTHL